MTWNYTQEVMQQSCCHCCTFEFVCRLARFLSDRCYFRVTDYYGLMEVWFALCTDMCYNLSFAGTISTFVYDVFKLRYTTLYKPINLLVAYITLKHHKINVVC